jgi:O-antigen/teichoic acid export membrane protein
MITTLRRNTAANIAGHVWTAALGLLFVPVYLRLMGMEAYGLIGLFMTVQAAVALLDPGAVATINRELAQAEQTGRPAVAVRSMVRTLEWIYLPIGVVIALIAWWGAAPVAENWLMPERMTYAEVSRALALMGVATAVQWPCFLYWAALNGMQRLPLLNGLNAVFATLKSVGVVPVLWLAGPTIENFLWWHVALGALQSAVFGVVAWRLLPGRGLPARFEWSELRRLSGFAGSVSVAAVLSFFFANSDRLVLAKLLSLDDFGHYALATTLATTVYKLSQPIAGAVYPRLSQYAATEDWQGQRLLYGNITQVMAVVVTAIVVMLALFPYATLLAWTGNQEVAAATAPILRLLVIGHGLAGIVALPYHLQLAHGRVRAWLLILGLTAALYIPLLIALAHRWGAEGGAAAWLLANAALLVAAAVYFHPRLLRTSSTQWWTQDFGQPVLAASTAGMLTWPFMNVIPKGLLGLVYLAAIGALVLGIAVIAVPHTRALLLSFAAEARRQLQRG